MNSLNLRQIDGGNVIKQADFGSNLSFELLDERRRKIPELDGQTATIKLIKGDNIAYQTESQVVDGSVSFKFDRVLEKGIYVLEIVADNYVFPSNNMVKITIEKTAGNYKPENMIKTDLVELQGKITAIEQREHDVNQELMTIGQNQVEMTKRIETLEQKEDHDTIYDDTEIKQSIVNVDNKMSGLSEKVTALEERPIVDTALTERVEALERKEDKDTVYNDSTIVKRIESLEAREDKDTVYDDTSLKAKIAELETALSTLVRKRPPMSFYIDRSDMSNMKAVFDNGCVMVSFPTSVYNHYYGYPSGHDGRSFSYYNLPAGLIKVSIGIVGIDSLKEERIANDIYYWNTAKILNPIYDSSQFNFDDIVLYDYSATNREQWDKDLRLACQRNFVKIAYEIGALNESEIIKLGATKK